MIFRPRGGRAAPAFRIAGGARRTAGGVWATAVLGVGHLVGIAATDARSVGIAVQGAILLAFAFRVATARGRPA